MGFAGKLVQDLADEGEVVARDSLDGRLYLVRTFQGRHFDPAVELLLDDPGIDSYLDAIEGDASEVFPDVDARLAAYRLTSVHVEEQLLMMGPRLLTLEFSHGRLISTRMSEDSDAGGQELEDPRDLKWIAAPRSTPSGFGDPS